jgi:hypothetical protein
MTPEPVPSPLGGIESAASVAPWMETREPRLRKRQMHRQRYTVKTTTDSRPEKGIVISLNVLLSSGGTGHGELLRHFTLDRAEAARDYERRLRIIADILNPSPAAAALEDAEAALDVAQAAIDHPRDRKRMLSALEVVREALRSL